MKQRKLTLLWIFGISLILIGLGVMLFLQIRMQTGQQQCRDILAQMEVLLPEKTPGIAGLYPDSPMPVLQLNNTDYAAMLEIPLFDIRLPVANDWSNRERSAVPARYFGSVHKETLVIGGDDFPHQFGFCDKIENGTLVTVTDMTGAQYRYAVTRIDRSSSAQAEWLTAADCDLTLFCRDMFTMEYIAVRCSLSYQ